MDVVQRNERMNKNTVVGAVLLLVVAAVGWWVVAEPTAQTAGQEEASGIRSLSQAPATRLATHELQQQVVEQAGFKVLLWERTDQGLNVQLAVPEAGDGAQLYLQRLALDKDACQEEADLGDSKVEAVNADTRVYRQQDPHSKVSPSVSVQRGQDCWLIEGSTGLDTEQDVATKLKLARLLPLAA